MPSPITIEKTDIADVWLIENPIFADERGFFMETYSKEALAAEGLDKSFVQDNLSLSRKGALRGLHYQIDPHAQGKLIRAVDGALFDVAVDLRRGSPTFGRWTGRTLSRENGLALWIPPGFAHGFLALEEPTVMLYKCTLAYDREAERSLAFDDPAIAIEWPFEPTVVSQKDREAPRLDEAEYNFVYGGNEEGA